MHSARSARTSKLRLAYTLPITTLFDDTIRSAALQLWRLALSVHFGALASCLRRLRDAHSGIARCDPPPARREGEAFGERAGSRDVPRADGMGRNRRSVSAEGTREDGQGLCLDAPH